MDINTTKTTFRLAHSPHRGLVAKRPARKANCPGSNTGPSSKFGFKYGSLLEVLASHVVYYLYQYIVVSGPSSKFTFEGARRPEDDQAETSRTWSSVVGLNVMARLIQAPAATLEAPSPMVGRPPWYKPPPWTLQGPCGKLREVDEHGLIRFCLEKGLSNSNVHVLIGLSWGNIYGKQGKREEQGWVRFEDIVFLRSGNGADELIYTIGHSQAALPVDRYKAHPIVRCPAGLTLSHHAHHERRLRRANTISGACGGQV